MRQFSDYDLLIFDCDGVILDSNALKIEAMKAALIDCGVSQNEALICSDFFAANFGKSRFYHVDYFVENLLTIAAGKIGAFKEQLLGNYSSQCKSLYLEADITPFVEDVFQKTSADLYVASGSEQGELRGVFKQRNLDKYFIEILGSPEKKVKHVKNILSKHHAANAVMIGDAVSDMEAARDNNIDFIFYSPYSNVEDKMREICTINQYRIIDSFDEVLTEL